LRLVPWCYRVGLILGLSVAAVTPAFAQEAPAAETPKKAAKPINPLLETCLKPADTQSAIISCTSAIESRQLKGEELAAALYRRGLAQGQRGQLATAINDFSSALKQTPDAADVLYARASAYGAMKRHDLAIADYDVLLKLVPDDPDSLYRRAWSRSAMGRDEAAVADLTALLASVKDDVDALMDRGGLYLRLGQFDKAAADFSALIKLDPKAAAAFYNRGRAGFLKGDFKAAAKDFAQAQTLRADNPYAALRRYLSGGQGVGDGKSKVHPEILTEAMAKLAPDQWPAPVLTTLAGQMTEQDLLSITAVSDKDVTRRLDAEAHYYLGEAALLEKETKVAKAHFTAAAKGERGVPEVIDAGWRLKQLP
jgi:tetratricopeptide (TPR) repeat protein